MAATDKKCDMNGYKLSFIGLRDYFESLLLARDRLQEEKDKLIDIRFSAIKDATAAAFASSEKAIAKSEAAQQAYNERSNEFRAALDDQSKSMMPRHEGLGMHAATAERIVNMQVAHQKDVDALRADITQLREFRSSETARNLQDAEQRGQRHWGVEMWLLALGGAVGWIALLVQHFGH